MKLMGNMIFFAGGMVAGMIYMKYENKINHCMKSMINTNLK